ncbi:hypothetical protein B0H14DRAFT_2406808 [Mycena olivaceomarginata]|nr:hypothetical protein B0H14DRAFT_2406808 [Mycena olivaceomarginata]
MLGRVRFSPHSTFHSPPPLLIRPALSSSTGSLLGPLTPPSLSYACLPGPTPFVPYYSYRSAKPSSGGVHALLAFSSAPLLNYDISLHPSSISSHYNGLTFFGFMDSAVYPPLRSLSLTTPHLPWSIVVPACDGRHVTVNDVLHAVYSALRANITSVEFNALGTQKLMRRASAACQRRCERLRGRRGYAEEKQGGIKRVDFLMGFTKFQGISSTSRSGDVWQLHIS